MKDKVKLGVFLFVIGFVGVLSLLTVSLPTSQLPQEVVEQFSPMQLKLLTLINPTLLLLIAVLVGVNVYSKVNLSVPLIQKYLLKQRKDVLVSNTLLFGLKGGIAAGIILAGIGNIYKAILPQEFEELGQSFNLTPLARFLYGGFTEEILLRFGFMSFITWFIFKITTKLNRFTFYTGIILAAILFAISHLPVVFQSLPAPSAGIISYIIIGNAVGGIIFGWIYLKKGLEAAFVSHITTHVMMMVAESLV